MLSNRGLLFPADAGTEPPYRLRCSEAYGASTAVVPALVVKPADHTLVIATPEMVAASDDQGCSWRPSFERRLSGTGLGGFCGPVE